MKKDLEKAQYKMATTAIHKLGDISNDTPDICRVDSEDEDNFYGAWVYGMGFIEVRFPKSTTHDLTEADIEKYDGKGMAIGNTYLGKLNVRD